MIKLELAADIYTKANIEKAKEIYKDYASIIVVPGKNKWNLVFHHCRYDEVRTTKEFENYLIGLENS